MAKILVVDDEAICGFFLGSSLEQEGHVVKTVTSAHQAIETASQFNPEILISDWMLKNTIDGVGLARVMLNGNPNLKVIFITGMDSDSLRKRAADLTYVGVIEKPLDLDEILKIVEKIK
jgi:DNA-binding response OmpR family regulator